MNIHSHVSPNHIYLLKEGLSPQQISAAVNRCLCQAEALAVIATIADVETVGIDTMNNYLWALSDMIQEACWLHAYMID
jgi:hypothetical protein